MAISDSQKVDYLFKKLGFGVTKTDTTAFKEAFNESIASPLLLRGENIWQQAGSIPATIPSASTSLVTVYKDSPGSWTATVQCTEDVTASDNRTWKTNSVDWISTEFGSTYQVKVYIDTTGATTPQTTGTQIFAAGSGNSDEWFFDYQSGVLHFIGTNIPSAITTGVTGKSIFISGARYVGAKGPTFPAGITVGNLTISGNNITSSSGNVTIAADLFVTGNTTLAGYSDITIFDSIINLHTQANLAAWTTNDGKDIGIKMHYYDGQDAHAGLVRANDTGFLEWYARGIEGYGNVFQGNAYGTIKTGELLLSNSTSSTSTSTGALRVLGGVGIAGNVFVGNILTNGYCYANGNPFTSYTNSDVAAYLPTHTGNIGAGNITVTSNIYGNIKTDYISSRNNAVTAFTGSTAVKLPIGTTAERPSGQNGLIRFNIDLPSIEYFDGTIWVPITNTVTDQQIIPDGTSTTYSLDQQATTIGVIVSINGIIQRPTVAYIVNTNQITFTEIPEATDIIDIRFLGAAVTINSTLTDDLVVSGNLTVNGNIVNTNNFYTYGNTQVAAYLVANPQGSTYSNANVVANLQNYVTSISTTANIATTANIIAPSYLYANGVNILSTISTYSNANVQSYIGANIGSLHSNAATQQVSINSINANIGSFYSYANTAFGTNSYSNTNVAAYLTTDATVTALQANLGATQTWANANIASINANIGGFYTWANTNFGTSSYSNTNANALLSSNTISTINTTGNVSVGGNLAVSGLLNLTTTANTNVDSQLVLQGNVYRGGAGYHDFLRVTNTNSGATNTNKFLRLDSTGQLQIINSAYTTNIFNLDNGGNLTVPGTITATSGVMAVPAWTSAGAITITATTTNPTKGTTTSDNISYRQLGAKQWEVVMTYVQTVANGVNGSGDYLFTLPNGLSFDTTLPSQPLYTGSVGTNTYVLMSYIIPSGSGLINNGALGGQVYPLVYNATKFRILTTSWGSSIQCWGSGYYSLGGDDPQIQLTFRFTSV